MTIEELIESHGRKRIARAVRDLKPGGEFEGRKARNLDRIAYAVLEAVGRKNREVKVPPEDPLWRAAYSSSIHKHVLYRIPENYTLPGPGEEIAAAINERRKHILDPTIAKMDADAAKEEAVRAPYVVEPARGVETSTEHDQQRAYAINQWSKLVDDMRELLAVPPARGVEIPEELVDALIRATASRKEMTLRARCMADQEEEAKEEEWAAAQAVTEYIMNATKPGDNDDQPATAPNPDTP